MLIYCSEGLNDDVKTFQFIWKGSNRWAKLFFKKRFSNRIFIQIHCKFKHFFVRVDNLSLSVVTMWSDQSIIHWCFYIWWNISHEKNRMMRFYNYTILLHQVKQVDYYVIRVISRKTWLNKQISKIISVKTFAL